MKKVAAYLGLVVTALTILTTFWAYAADFTRMQEDIKGKASKVDVIDVHRKLDLIICYLDKNRCLKD